MPFLHHVAEELEEHFHIGHATIQLEIDRAAACALEPDSVV